MATTWNSIVAGVDASLEGATAATMACALARTAKASCHLVHAVREPATEIAPTQLPMDLAPMARRLMDLARDEVAEIFLTRPGRRSTGPSGMRRSLVPSWW